MWPGWSRRWADPVSRSRLLPNTLLRWFYGVEKPAAGGPRTTGSATTSPPVATADVACAAQALATRMPDLLLHASQMATTLASGLHPQRRAGWGDTFWQYRPAQPGEPANRIDWRQSARTTRAHVLHISDPAENTLPYSGRTEFSGLEDEPTLELPHVQSLRADYTNLVTARARWLEQTIGRTGHTLTRHQTDMAPLPTLLALHAQMSQRV